MCVLTPGNLCQDRVRLCNKYPNGQTYHTNMATSFLYAKNGDQALFVVAVHDIDKRGSATVERRGVTTGGIASPVAGAIRLNNLSDDDVSALRSFLHRKRFIPGEIIIKQGDPGDGNLYFLLQGEGTVEVFGEKVATIQSGNSFGEIALWFGAGL